MMTIKNILFYFILLIIISSSCYNNDNKEADNLCSCYTKLHRERNEDKILLIGDSCNKLYSEILQKYKDNNEGKEEFLNAYKECQ
jgi:hypothetical protein